MTDSTVQLDEAGLISRGATGRRILVTILVILVVRVIEAVLAMIILFELGFSLVTRCTPGPRVVRFADRVVRYGCEIGQYVTFNRAEAPFPFDDLPSGDEPEQATVCSPTVV